MRTKLLAVLLACCVLAVGTAYSQTMDDEMAGLADKISKALVARGCKNVAAVDFTDLQGQPTELGRFLSEQLTVEIVSTGGVSMVDRANIKSILAEHKLAEEGLVDPANAKKLGEFAGVDAILVGNVTELDDGIVLMVRAISTGSANIVAAGRIKFSKSSEGSIPASGIPAKDIRGNTSTDQQLLKLSGRWRLVSEVPRGLVNPNRTLEFVADGSTITLGKAVYYPDGRPAVGVPGFARWNSGVLTIELNDGGSKQIIKYSLSADGQVLTRQAQLIRDGAVTSNTAVYSRD